MYYIQLKIAGLYGCDLLQWANWWEEGPQGRFWVQFPLPSSVPVAITCDHLAKDRRRPCELRAVV